MKFLKIIISSLVLFALLSFSFGKQKNSLKKNVQSKEGYYETSYGKFSNNTIFIKSAILPNELLTSVFAKYHLSGVKASKVSNYSDELFDPRKFKTGNIYVFILEKEGNSFVTKNFIYEKNMVDYAKFEFEDENISGELKSKPIERKRLVHNGIIKGSLYQTMIDVGANPLLAVELAEIYKWTIDFYKIQENDAFKAIYYEDFVEGKSIGEFEIEASEFFFRGKTHDAFAYGEDKNGITQYYDHEGQTLKEFFLQAPVAYSRISSPYSKNRFHPVTKQNKPHLGTDYAAPTGTPIYSTADGVVIEAQFKKYNGNYVKIKHNETYTTQYLHMSKIAKGIKKGVAVEQGQVIGYVGSTGLATGPHVCYRFWKNGKQVDPYGIDIPKAKPLAKEEMPKFKEHIQALIEELNKLTKENS